MTPVPLRFRPPKTLLAVILALAACGRGEDAPAGSGAAARAGTEAAPIVVAVSVQPLAGLVERLVPHDARVEIHVLVPAGSSPHAFEPGVEQLRELARARVVLLIGHPAFTWERTWLADALGPEPGRAVPLAASCPAIPDDPHVWLDPECLETMAREAAGALGAAMPGRIDEIGRRLGAVLAATDSATAEAAALLRPTAGSTFLVVHPAWGYFARAFGLEQLSILSHGSGDSGAARLVEVIERARREGIRAVVVQPQYAAEAARVVAEEIGGRVVELDPLARDPVALLVETAAILAAAAGR